MPANNQHKLAKKDYLSDCIVIGQANSSEFGVKAL